VLVFTSFAPDLLYGDLRINKFTKS
jgi:hypothetical protein